MENKTPQWRFFLSEYLKAFKFGPKTHITHKQWISTLFNRLLEIPTIFLLWMSSKISPRVEKLFALKISKKWTFKPIPDAATLSAEAVNYTRKKIIDIQAKVDAQTVLLDVTSFREILDKFPFSMIAECGCRSVNQQCDSPRHTCMMLGWAADSTSHLQDNKQHQLTTPEEIETLVDTTDKWALVHMALNYPDNYHTYVICNCCDCCCVGFRELKMHGVPFINGSKYVAKINPSKCKGCYHCINYRCRFQAIVKVNEDGTVIDPRKEDRERFKLKWHRWSERRNGWGLRIHKDPAFWKRVKANHPGKWQAGVDLSRCFGCGNCASPKYGCPEKAIQLYPRSID